MASSVFSIDYSGGTVGESHPVPFFQNQQVHANLRVGGWSMDKAKASGWRPLWTDKFVSYYVFAVYVKVTVPVYAPSTAASNSALLTCIVICSDLEEIPACVPTV